MLTQQTVDTMKAMRLSAMASELSRQLEDPITYSKLDFDERVGMLVEAEWTRRQQNKLAKYVRTANFNLPRAQVEEIEYYPDRKLNKADILRYSTCAYIDRGNHILITGTSGNGKTFLGCALGNSACRKFKTVKYARMQELLENLAIAKAQDPAEYRKVLNSYRKWDLLILDEFLLRRLRPEETSDLLEIVEIRSRGDGDKAGRSMIICSQYEPSDWYPRISQGDLEHDPETEAIIERIIHNSYTIHIEGKMSMRERHGLRPPSEPAPAKGSVEDVTAKGGDPV